MTPKLWTTNTPQNFWLLDPEFSDDVWNLAIQSAIPQFGFPPAIKSLDDVLEYSLGEARFGKNRYKIGAIRCAYYLLKPLIPRSIIFWLRQRYNLALNSKSAPDWPIESRYAKFQWEVLRQVMLLNDKQEISFRCFWPNGKRYAFVLTHDIETGEGQRQVPVLAEIEEALGFRSMFNFVPELYPLDWGLIRDLQNRGFEVGIHGLKHDNRLFDTHKRFVQRSVRINHHIRQFQARGFRAPLTIRNPEWMQLLDMEYDLSFFDTDPYEPIPGGVMSIWPFNIGRFLELPYTLPQDCTLYKIMGETSPRIWLEKIDFIEQYHGMALVIVHPDYSSIGKAKEIYRTFLNVMSERTGYWHAVPRDVASWWKARAAGRDDPNGNLSLMARAVLMENNLSIQLPISDDIVTNSAAQNSLV